MKNEQKLGGFGGLGGADFILEQYAKRMMITKPHTKFELSSSKHSEVIPSRKMNKNKGTWGGGLEGF